MVRSGEARRLTDGTVDICDDAARPANSVMMIVAHPSLIAREGTGGLHAAQHTHFGQRVQHVVRGLTAHIGQASAHDFEDRLRIRVRVGVHRREHSNSRAGHA